MSGKTEIYISDVHWPYEDKTACALTKQVITALQPDILFMGGDLVDFYPVSSFDKDPARKQELQNELDYASAELSALRTAAPDAEVFYQEGNHESRLTRYMWKRAEELAPLRSLALPELLSFKKLGINWIPQGTVKKIGHLNHIHGNEIAGGSTYPAKNIFLKAPGNIICGHYHKIQSHYHRLLDGNLYGVWTNGCLCTLTPEYILLPQWQQGFSIVRYAKSGAFHVTQVPLFPATSGKGLSCLVDGMLYTEKEKRKRK